MDIRMSWGDLCSVTTSQVFPRQKQLRDEKARGNAASSFDRASWERSPKPWRGCLIGATGRYSAHFSTNQSERGWKANQDNKKPIPPPIAGRRWVFLKRERRLKPSSSSEARSAVRWLLCPRERSWMVRPLVKVSAPAPPDPGGWKQGTASVSAPMHR